MTARRLQPRPVLIAVATLVAVLLVGLPPLLPGGGGGFSVTSQLVPLAFADEGDGTWVSSAVSGKPTVAGLTWEDDDEPEEAWVRVRGPEGWSAWDHVEVDDEHVPDESRPEGSGPAHASAPIIVAGASEVQFKVQSSDQPETMQASMVRVDGQVRSASVRGAAADAAPSQPSMVMRNQWGGDECLSSAGKTSNPRYVKRVQVMFVHHTAGSNDYTQDRSAAIVRGICDYHVRVRDYDDIAYNFLIDKFGTVYEGRGGGIAAGVQGAHTGGFNSYSTGVSFMGTHSTSAPTSPAQTALRNLGSWKLDIHHVDPKGYSYLKSLGSSKYSYGTTVRMANVSGHRDASSTSCPGGACYNLLPDFRIAMRNHGGAKLFGGWPDKNPIPGSQGDGYETATFPVGAKPDMPVTFEILDGDKVIVRRTDSGTRMAFTWDGTVNGRAMPVGTYRVRVTGSPASGAAPRAINWQFQLGAFLPPFVDDDGHLFEADIAWIAGQGITKGCNPPTNDRFCPDDPVLRKQMAAFLVRAYGLTKTSSAGSFKDVPSGSTFAKDINKLATAGITKGCNPPANDRFCPDASVLRKQMAAFLVRAEGLTKTSSAGNFKDVPSGSTFAEDINKLATAGITKGCNPPDNDRFCPDDRVTRGQMAAFIRRALE